MPNYYSYFYLELALAKEEKDELLDNADVPQIEPLLPVLLCDDPLLKHLVAAEEAENGYFLLIRTLYVFPGIELGAVDCVINEI